MEHEIREKYIDISYLDKKVTVTNEKYSLLL